MGSESSAFYRSTSVGAVVGASVGGSVGASVGCPVAAIVGASVGGSVGASVGASVAGSAASSSSSSRGSASYGSASGGSCSSSSSSAWNEIITRKQELSDFDWYTRIEKKLEKCGLITGATDENDRKKLIYSLGMKGVFKETYLTLNRSYNENILQKINEDIKLMNDLPEFLKQDMTEDEKSIYIDQLLKYRREAKTLDVRMFLSKLSFMRPRKLFFFPEFGAVHAGLEIDGVTIEWGRESLVFPSINTKSMLIHARIHFEEIFPETIWGHIKGFIQHPLNYISIVYQLIRDRILAIGRVSQNKLDQIESVCIHYNRNVTYNVVNRNCQTFMRDILNAIGLKFQPEGEFKNFMDRITSGNEEVGKFQFMSTIFESRCQFDQYVNQRWDSITNKWDKKLLICYSDMMNDLHRAKTEEKWEKWGPIDDEQKWLERVENVA